MQLNTKRQTSLSKAEALEQQVERQSINPHQVVLYIFFLFCVRLNPGFFLLLTGYLDFHASYLVSTGDLTSI